MSQETQLRSRLGKNLVESKKEILTNAIWKVVSIIVLPVHMSRSCSLLFAVAGDGVVVGRGVEGLALATRVLDLRLVQLGAPRPAVVEHPAGAQVRLLQALAC